MSGERNLTILLQSLNPELDPDDWVFCSIPVENESELEVRQDAWAIIREREGLTLILPRESADRHLLPYETLFRRITLSVHSSLEAVGMTAAVSSRLAERNISANVVAGYYHDHVFVPSGDAKRAMEAIRGLSGASQD